MQCDFALDADIILAVRRVQANVFRKGSRTLRGRRLTVSRPLRRERDEKIAQAHATPVNNLAPTLNTLELRDHLYVRELPYIRHREQQPGNSRRHIFGHLHRLHLYSSTFCVLLVHTQLLRSHSATEVRSRSARHVHSVGPRRNVSAVLCIGRRVRDTDKLQAPVLGADLRESDIAIAAEGTHCFGLLELGRQCSFAKKSAGYSSVKLHRFAERRNESVHFWPDIQPFPNTGTRHGGYRGGFKTTARAALEPPRPFVVALRKC